MVHRLSLMVDRFDIGVHVWISAYDMLLRLLVRYHIGGLLLLVLVTVLGHVGDPTLAHLR